MNAHAFSLLLIFLFGVEERLLNAKMPGDSTLFVFPQSSVPYQNDGSKLALYCLRILGRTGSRVKSDNKS